MLELQAYATRARAAGMRHTCERCRHTPHVLGLQAYATRVRGAACGAHQQILGHRVLHAVSSKGGEFTRKMPFVYNYNCMAILIIIANAVRDVFWGYARG